MELSTTKWTGCRLEEKEMKERKWEYTLSGFLFKISTIFLPDSCPTLSPDPSDFLNPVLSDPSVLRNFSSS